MTEATPTLRKLHELRELLFGLLLGDEIDADAYLRAQDKLNEAIDVYIGRIASQP